jgi:hypothetical protein
MQRQQWPQQARSGPQAGLRLLHWEKKMGRAGSAAAGRAGTAVLPVAGGTTRMIALPGPFTTEPNKQAAY